MKIPSSITYVTSCLTCSLDHLGLLVDNLVISTSDSVVTINEDDTLAIAHRVTLVERILLILELGIDDNLPVPSLDLSPGEAVIHGELSLLLVGVGVSSWYHVVCSAQVEPCPAFSVESSTPAVVRTSFKGFVFGVVSSAREAMSVAPVVHSLP